MSRGADKDIRKRLRLLSQGFHNIQMLIFRSGKKQYWVSCPTLGIRLIKVVKPSEQHFQRNPVKGIGGPNLLEVLECEFHAHGQRTLLSVLPSLFEHR